MTRPIHATLVGLLLVVVAASVAVPALLPTASVRTPEPHWPAADDLTARGAYHVHSVRSDGTGTDDEIAEAAARAGLQFVVITDHGDGTRPPTPPQYRSGVLCIDAVEVNTTGGHLVVLGAAPSNYPLAGTPRAVLEDVHRLGGAGIAAHPGSPRESLRWSSWGAPIDGLEWLNADSEWRDELAGSLGRLLLTYPFRPAESLASMLDRPEHVMEQWDAAAARGRTVGLAGADAHARLGLRRQSEPYADRWHLPLPSYEASFRTFSLRVRLDAPLAGDAVRDARDIVDRLRGGRVYTVIDALAGPGAFEFSATSGGYSARMGDALEIAGAVTLHARMAAPPETRLVVVKDGETLYDTTDREMHLGVGASPGVYRIELQTPNAPGHPPMPWLVSNPIYVGMRPAHEAAARSSIRPEAASMENLSVNEATEETSPGTESEVEPVPDGGVAWRYTLSDVQGAYAALRWPVNGLTAADRLELRARADAPMRLWVQLRTSRSGTEERWGQTVYLDTAERIQRVFFDEFEPIGPTATPRPRLDEIQALLLVEDWVNAKPGSTGRVSFSDLRLGLR